MTNGRSRSTGRISESSDTWAEPALKDSVLKPLWLDNPRRPPARPALAGPTTTDLLVVGGGFTGLWSALRAVERDPSRSVLLIEADRIAEHATGKNGGFCETSLTHGEANGQARWPNETQVLDRLGAQNVDGIEATIRRYGIDCGFSRGGVLAVATREHEVTGLDPDEPGFLDQNAVQRIVHSPTYLAGRLDSGAGALVDPARLAWGLAEAAENHDVRIAEGTRLLRIRRNGDLIECQTTGGLVQARNVILATNVFPNAIRRWRHFTVPVYDFALATEPLSIDQQSRVGWPDHAVGVADLGNQFHYYRFTPDNRILFGGYDAIYHYGGPIRPEFYERKTTYETLARHFRETFPQLDGVRFTHRWAGVVDTSTRFCAMFNTTHGGRTVSAVGFTGLGVGASRFAADVMLDRLADERTERTALEMVRKRPLPFPPEPFAYIGIQLTRWSLARADRHGKRNLWLRLMDRLGIGFDS